MTFFFIKVINTKTNSMFYLFTNSYCKIDLYSRIQLLLGGRECKSMFNILMFKVVFDNLFFQFHLYNILYYPLGQYMALHYTYNSELNCKLQILIAFQYSIRIAVVLVH